MNDFFKNLFGGSKTQSVLGIDIGSSSIKIVQLRRKGSQAILETYGELSLGPYAHVSPGVATALPQDKIIEALHDVLIEKEVNITTDVCGISIPFSASLMSVIELPDVSKSELATMIPLEARKYIPVPVSEVKLDWSVIPRTDEIKPDISIQSIDGQENSTKRKTVDVLMVAIHNGTLERYDEIVKANKLDRRFYEIELFSSMRSLVEQNLQPIVIVDMGAATTKLFIVERGILKASHTINRGSQNVTQAIAKSIGVADEQAEIIKRNKGLLGEDMEGKEVAKIIMLTLEYIFEEANRTILAFEKKYNRNIQRIIMAGGGSALKGLNEVAKKSFQTEVISADPFSKVVTPVFLHDLLKQAGPQFGVALGLALRALEEV